MMGHSYECTDCDFEFCSGWSHHAGGLFLVCPACAAHYVLGRGQSVWGPREGETLWLIEEGANDDQQSNEPYVANIRPVTDVEEWDGVVRLVIEDLRCPKCTAHERLTQEFAEHQICPQCKIGIIERRGSCIY